jgi:hypothetical protein
VSTGAVVLIRKDMEFAVVIAGQCVDRQGDAILEGLHPWPEPVTIGRRTSDGLAGEQFGKKTEHDSLLSFDVC